MDLKTTPLNDLHKKLNAKMAPFAGFEMPLQYSSVKEEVKAVREHIGIFDVSHMGEFFCEGKDAVKFVDYLMCNDFASAEEGKAVYSPLCRENGTVVDDLIAYKISNEKVLICVNAANIGKDYQWFMSHKEGFDFELIDRSDQYSLLAIQGPKTEEILTKFELLKTNEDLPYYSVAEREHNGEKIIMARTGYTGEDGFEIFCSDNFARNLWENLVEAGAAPCGLASRDVLRLEVCFPLYGHELTDDLTPLDCGAKWTVKMNKTRFIGKEFLENYKPKKRLIKLSLDKGIPREGYKVLNDKDEVVGEVTSGTMSVILGKGIALALVERDKFPKDKSFSIQVRNRKFPATYNTKPFVKGGHK